MGKNLYETPRDMSKWHTQKDGHEKVHTTSGEDKKAHLEELKKRFQKNKK
ncbi:MAG: hypothetical protein UDB11_01185 [Peptococcaceae bacterium]|nr:hypothetical protein [Peptococcaceae bacterium]